MTMIERFVTGWDVDVEDAELRVLERHVMPRFLRHRNLGSDGGDHGENDEANPARNAAKAFRKTARNAAKAFRETA
jgi:hypothetical protein